MELLRTKTVEQVAERRRGIGPEAAPRAGVRALTGIGIAVIIGTGIFVLTGEAAGTIAGPAVALSCVVAANRLLPGGALLRGVAATVPVAGSAYTFSYASLGELVAWIIGWDLMLELAFAAATVAIPGRSPVKAPPRSERRQLTAPKWWLI